jgi:hypothetical protein
VHAFGAALRRVKTALLAGPSPARACDHSRRLAMRNTTTFPRGLAAAWAPIVAVWIPILVYVAWSTW